MGTTRRGAMLPTEKTSGDLPKATTKTKSPGMGPRKDGSGSTQVPSR